MSDEQVDNSLVTFADGRKALASLVTKPLAKPSAEPDKKSTPAWVKCTSLPDCAEKNPEIIAGPTSDAGQVKSRATTKLEYAPESLPAAFSRHLDELDLDK